MFRSIFEKPTLIDDEKQLRKLFRTDRLFMENCASVVLEGSIALGTDIVFAGTCRLADGVSLGNGCILTNVHLGAESKVRHYSILDNVKAGSCNIFGPFCFIRDACKVGDNCILGAHVEVARSTFASGVKISHRAYVGDATIGQGTIIGAGVIFCNYDGTGRQSTSVGAGVILGSGALLIAPLLIGDNALIAAGSTVTKDVHSGAKFIQKRF